MKQRKIPLRRCTGCQEMKDKRQLVRVALNQNGEFSLDLTGKSPGRGAYICKNIDCFEKAAKSRGFDRSFKCSVPKEVYANLKMELQKKDVDSL